MPLRRARIDDRCARTARDGGRSAVHGYAGCTCAGLVASTTQNCGLFTLGEPSPSQTLTGSFQADNDVALFQFILTGAAACRHPRAAIATALDPLIGLFSGTTGNIVRYLDVERRALKSMRKTTTSTSTPGTSMQRYLSYSSILVRTSSRYCKRETISLRVWIASTAFWPVSASTMTPDYMTRWDLRSWRRAISH